MLHAIVALLGCQLAGEAMVRALAVPVPGPVVGMLLLAAAMLARLPLPRALESVAGGLLAHLTLLFVPAGVGLIQHLDRLSQDGLRLFFVVLVSTVVTLAVTAAVFAALTRLLGITASERGAPEDDA